MVSDALPAATLLIAPITSLLVERDRLDRIPANAFAAFVRSAKIYASPAIRRRRILFDRAPPPELRLC